MTASANANGVNTLDLLAAKVNFTLDAPQTPPPDPCGTRQCPVPTSTPTNTPTPTYKITLGQDLTTTWTSSELAAINGAVEKLGQAFQLQFTSMSMPVASPQEAFNRVMANGSNPQYVYFYKVDIPTGAPVTITYPAALNKAPFTIINDPEVVTDDGVTYGGCLTVNYNALPRTIVCNWGSGAGQSSSFPEHALVHELGHVFTNRSVYNDSTNSTERNNGLLFAAIQGTYSGNCTPAFEPPMPTPNPFAEMMFPISSCSSVNDINGDQGLVMGRNSQLVWRRGERGWGSGPDNDFTPFQMHPPDLAIFSGDTDTVKVDEAAADMFLNWVYRISTNNPTVYQNPTHVPGYWLGFLNYSWANNASTATPDHAYPGDSRDEWMSRVMHRIFGIKNW